MKIIGSGQSHLNRKRALTLWLAPFKVCLVSLFLVFDKDSFLDIL